ncbi:MAG: NADH-quinone oxidoreductase subunit J [Zoogloeaceae bacterium]|jgi:NADH-quinone oxidoreductase subunit J|nr:NADH-quinone oxidoreductase subunit J [Zoogloeaceae bacterium]
MDFKTLLFFFFSAILLFAALRVITAKNPVHAVLNLILAFFTAAGIWLLLEAEFLAMVLVMVYIGAVMVLFLFVVMMLDIDLDRLRQGFWRYLPLGAFVGLVVALEMALVLGGEYFYSSADANLPAAAAGVSNTRELGALLVSRYVYPFELTAALLLMAIVAAVALAFRGKKPARRVDPAEQIRVRAADRLRIVHMPTETDDAPPAAIDDQPEKDA